MSKNTKVVFVMCQGHSGSTLLGLTLGSHPEIFGLGELARLDKHFPRICGICESSCEFWQRRASLPVLQRYFSTGWNLRSMAGELDRRRRSIYSYLSEWFGYSILVDSSKYPAWIRGQLRYRQHWKTMTPILLHLVRDGRAVINSHLRKSPEKGIEEVTRRWIHSTGNILKLYDQFEWPKYRLAYEDLASRPDETIRSICRFLEVDYLPDMLNYWEHEHHQIGGNTGARSLISRTDSTDIHHPVVNPGNWHDGYYNQMGKAIQLDLRWKKELSQEQLEYFEKHAGELNQPFRYETNDPPSNPHP